MTGTFRITGDNALYIAPIKEGSSITCTLGEIRKKNDGRFFWYRKELKPQFFKWTHEINGVTQGVAETFEDAQRKILEGWE